MLLNKWNYDTHEYDKYSVPKEWNCKIYSNDMNEKVNCPHCGKKMEYGSTYASLEVHDEGFGLGYGVCYQCYEKEWERRRKYKE